MKKQISPSMMCADFMNLKETLNIFEKEKIEFLHIDIMDGSFVPNFTLGTDFCRALRNTTDIPLDIHLMVNNPELKIDWFPIRSNDIVSVHCESNGDIRAALSEIKFLGAKSFLAINPPTSEEIIDRYIDLIDGILVMAVNPGFAGQKMVPGIPEKISRIKSRIVSLKKYDLKIEVDGNVSFVNAGLMSKAGADIFVAGTSAVFRKDMSISEGINFLRESVR